MVVLLFIFPLLANFAKLNSAYDSFLANSPESFFMEAISFVISVSLLGVKLQIVRFAFVLEEHSHGKVNSEFLADT